MPRQYIPGTISEVVDYLGSIMLSPPTMKDPDFPDRTVESRFFALNEGFARVRKKLGEARYGKLIELSNRMRAHFEADPDDTNGEAHKGYLVIHEMDDLLLDRAPKT